MEGPDFRRNMVLLAAAWDVVATVGYALIEGGWDAMGALILAVFPLLALPLLGRPTAFRIVCLLVGLLHLVPVLVFFYFYFPTAALLFAAVASGAFFRIAWVFLASTVAGITLLAFGIGEIKERQSEDNRQSRLESFPRNND